MDSWNKEMMLSTKTILSFDIGIKNLAFAVIEVNDNKRMRLRRWGILNLTCSFEKDKKKSSKMTPDDLVTSLVYELDREFGDGEVFDIVLLENQPSRKNPIMKNIQMAMHSYFATMRLHMATVGQIRLVGATQKLVCSAASTMLTSTSTSSYKDRKAMSIQLTALYIPQLLPDKSSSSSPSSSIVECSGDELVHVVEVYRAFKKRDDLCDAFLQAVTFTEKWGTGTERNEQ